MSILRLCHPQDFYTFFYHEHDHFGGSVFGNWANDFLNVFKRKMNATIELVSGKGYGERIGDTEQFTGCIGELQRNQSDLIVSLVNYPIEAQNVSQGFVVFESFVTIGQMYFLPESVKNAQILSSFRAIMDILPYIFISLLLIWVSILARRKFLQIALPPVFRMRGYRIRSRTRRINHNYLYQVLAHASRNGSIRGHTKFHRIIYLALSIYSLVINNFMSSSVKTDLVIIEDPKIFESYDQLIRERIKPGFIQGTNIDSLFRYAQNGSIEKKFWTYADSHFVPSEMFFPPERTTVLRLAAQMLRRKAVMILDDSLSSLIQFAACKLRTKKKENLKQLFGQLYYFFKNEEMEPESLQNYFKFLYYTKVDSSSKSLVKAFLLSNYFEKTTSRRIKSTLRTSIEAGIANYIREYIKSVDLLPDDNVPLVKNVLGQDIPAQFKYMRDCLSESIIKTEASAVKKISLVNFKSLLVLCLILSAICSIILIIELAYYRLVLWMQGH